MAHVSDNQSAIDFEPLPIYRRPKDDDKDNDVSTKVPTPSHSVYTNVLLCGERWLFTKQNPFVKGTLHLMVFIS